MFSAYLQRRITFTFTPSSGGLALTSAMLSNVRAVPLSLLLAGDLLAEFCMEPLAARPGRRAAGSTFHAA
jgi:hypothetical protein